MFFSKNSIKLVYCKKQISCLIVKLQILHCAAFCYGWLVLQSTLLLMQFSNVFLALPLLQKNLGTAPFIQHLRKNPRVGLLGILLSWVWSRFVRIGVLEVTQPCNDRKTHPAGITQQPHLPVTVRSAVYSAHGNLILAYITLKVSPSWTGLWNSVVWSKETFKCFWSLQETSGCTGATSAPSLQFL